MAPELGKEPNLPERDIDDGIITRLLTTMIFQLAKRDQRLIENEIFKLTGEKIENPDQSDEAPPCWTEFLASYGRLAGQVLRIQTKITKNYTQILPLMGRHCRDMLSDQGK
jgi:hypothetical protein